MKITFEQFRVWLVEKCKTSYKTANLGHQGSGITAKYAPKTNTLTIGFGTKDREGRLKDDELCVIFARYLALGKRRHKAGRYSYRIFKDAPDMVLTPFVPALIRDFECELLLKNSPYV